MNKFKINNKILVGVFLASVVAFSARVYFAKDYGEILRNGGVYTSDNSHIGNKKVVKDEEYSLDGIKNIYANVAGKVEVSYSENDKARVVIYKNSKDKNNIKIEKESGKLNIVDEKKIKVINIGFFEDMKTPIVKLYIPKKYANDIELKTRDGGIDYKDVKANNLKLTSSAGKITGENIEAKNIDIKSSAGSIDIDGFKGKLTSDNSAGRTEIKCNELVGDINIDSSAGSVKLYIPEKSEFTLNAETTAGSIDNDFEEGMSEKSEAAHDSVTGKVGSGRYNIELDSSAGGIDIFKR
ncbi:DUF4097 family beta strand repeat-containing protein [Clostridium oceanicum]|uniref:DUF4097 family beta strand repeat-containing protein n=1 Tax=Clostridium oceanicum TaxID=1543 RepID=A0ABN1JFK9_9CLOT